jgi:hypothetical protein
MFKAIRVTLLLFILFVVAGATWATKYRALKWDTALDVVVYPINADGSEATRKYIARLNQDNLQPIAGFMQTEARRYGLTANEPIRVWLGPEVSATPPQPPIGGNVFSVMSWSLKLRYWASQHDAFSGNKPNIRLFALYHDPARVQSLSHSLGLEKGMIGVAHVFASDRQAGANNIVLAHEMLHTLGASDKYDLATNLPLYPAGYAEPALTPRYPQASAEIMAGRTPLSATKAETPDDLTQAVIGAETARELRWLK